jgi:hypothetical protein
MLLADALPEDQGDSERDGRETVGAVMALIAPVEFLLLDLISVSAGTALSGKDATEFLLLLAVLVEDRGVGMSVASLPEVKRLSMKDRRYRFALSLGPASFSVK